MKKSTASKPPINWFPFLVVAVPCLWLLVFWLRDWPLAAITALMSLYQTFDAWKLVATRRKSAQKEGKFPKPNASKP